MNYKKELPYRKGVGIMLFNSNKKVFVGKRIDNTKAWQMPQGGIEYNEDTIEAMKRELQEETGITSIKIIKQSFLEHTYDLPEHLIRKLWNGKYKGQKQSWFLVKFLGEDNEIKLDQRNPEFNDWKWVNVQELTKLIVPFKKKLYQKLIIEFKNLI